MVWIGVISKGAMFSSDATRVIRGRLARTLRLVTMHSVVAQYISCASVRVHLRLRVWNLKFVDLDWYKNVWAK